MTRRKVWSLLIAVMLLLSMIPTLGVAAEPAVNWPAVGQTVKINGESYTYKGELTNGYFTVLASESANLATAYTIEDGYILWDGDKNLTLHNAVLTNGGVYNAAIFSKRALNIHLEGENAIIAQSTGAHVRGIYTFGSSTDTTAIYGDGLLSMLVGNEAPQGVPNKNITATGILCNHNLEIGQNANVAALIFGEVGEAEGFSSYGLTIRDASVTAISVGSDTTSAIFSYEDVTLKDCRLLAGAIYSDEEDPSKSATAIDSLGAVTVDNTILILASASTHEATALHADSAIKIINGSAVELEIGGAEDIPLHSSIVGQSISVNDSYIWSQGGGVTHADNSALSSVSLKNAFFLSPEDGKVACITVSELAKYVNTFFVDSNNEPLTEYIVSPKLYPDVAGDLWYAPTVAFSTARGLFQGNEKGEFQPDANMTRAQMWTVLARLSGFDTTPDAGEEWYENAREWSMENGVSDGTNPNDNITREQMVTMLWRYLGEPEGSIELSAIFPDGDQTSNWAEEALCWAVENGIINGNADGTLDPLGSATRAQIAQMIKNFLINY